MRRCFRNILCSDKQKIRRISAETAEKSISVYTAHGTVQRGLFFNDAASRRIYERSRAVHYNYLRFGFSVAVSGNHFSERKAEPKNNPIVSPMPCRNFLSGSIIIAI